jgi:hypothetical protein
MEVESRVAAGGKWRINECDCACGAGTKRRKGLGNGRISHKGFGGHGLDGLVIAARIKTVTAARARRVAWGEKRKRSHKGFAGMRLGI